MSVNPPPPELGPLDLRGILGPEHLAGLRAGYDNAAMRGGATHAVVAPFPPGSASTVAFMASYVGDDTPHTWLPRERATIAVLASQGGGQDLAIHLYWGLAVGMEVDELLHMLSTVGVYAGVSRYFGSLKLCRAVFTALAALPPDKLDSRSCVGAIVVAVP